jgi:hypothetical protein
MSERERWIVYPLLFLALGAALRDKLFDQTTSKRIVCQELTVVDEEPIGLRPARILARIGKADPTSPGAAPIGYLLVDGQLSVNGVVDAQNYAIGGVPILPSLRAVLTGDLLRALRQSTQSWQQMNAPKGNPSNRDGSAAAPSDNTTPQADETSPGSPPK